MLNESHLTAHIILDGLDLGMFKKVTPFIVLTLFSVLIPQAGMTASPLHDSLVEDLHCQNLSPEEIRRKIRPDAFSQAYHQPVRNWSFSVGLYDLAACWSLARSQRLFFYLTRWGETSPSSDPNKTTFEVLEMIRGTSPYAHIDDPSISEFPLKEYTVVSRPDNTWLPTTPLWLSLQQGFKQTFPNDKTLLRTFRSEIEFYQNRRFHDFLKNIRYVVGDGSRSPEKNRLTRNQIIKNLEDNKLPLLLLRPKRVSQHVVLAKSFATKANGDIEFSVYDSNSPAQNQIITFSGSDQEFYAPAVVRGLPRVEDPQAPLGVYVVDDSEFKILDKTLLNYYQRKCQGAK